MAANSAINSPPLIVPVGLGAFGVAIFCNAGGAGACTPFSIAASPAAFLA
jgi:hypothetical protein